MNEAVSRRFLTVLASLLALAGCGAQVRPELIHVASPRQPWIALQSGDLFCYFNLHWNASTDTEAMVQLFNARHKRPWDSGALMIDSISRDIVVGLDRDLAGDCDTDVLADWFLGIASLEVSDASRVTESDWLDAKAGKSNLICRQTIATSLTETDLTKALDRIGKQSQGGIVQLNIVDVTVELELYRNCSMPEHEREQRYLALIELNGK